jgi:glycosyltransferase involved in cell wall biosynthesis
VKVSLVATVKDAGPAIHGFLASVAAQTRAPDEVVVVDGGSTDGTLQVLEKASGITLITEPGANISRGRNVAVRAAAHDVIAVTDADCALAPDWLERILEPLNAGASVVAGFYRPVGSNLVQRLTAAVSLPDREEVRPGWMPSSRSLAFRREAFDAVGGYPEWLTVGEDMYFDHRLVEAGYQPVLALDAVAGWELRATLAATWRQYFRYAEGDALAGMYPERHALRFATYAGLLLALVVRRWWLIVPAAAGAVAYARTPLRRIWRRSTPDARPIGVLGVPPMMAFIDVAKMAGYVRGLVRRARRS